jgi:hypothetical protein
MPRVIPKSLAAKAAALNSGFSFSTQVSPERDERGKQVIDEHKQPVSNRSVLCTLVNKADGRPWLQDTGATEEQALENVCRKAEHVERPASTAAQVLKENDTLKAELARIKAENDRLRSTSVHVREGDSQRRRSQPAAEEPAPAITPSTEPSTEEVPPEGDSAGELRSLLRNAGVKVPANATIDKLRTLAAANGLVPA